MSSSPYLCYKELIPPTNVDCSIFFKVNKKEYLLITSASTINIYKICKNNKKDDESINGNNYFLSLFCQYKLFGKAQDLHTYNIISKNGKYEYQRIILSIDIGKIVILEFDPLQASIVPIVMYNAEEDAIGMGSEVKADTNGRQIFIGLGPTPYLVVDENSTLACALIYGFQLFFIPLEECIIASSERKKSYMNSNIKSNTSTPYSSPRSPRSNIKTSKSLESNSAVSKNLDSFVKKHPERFVIDIQSSLFLFGSIIDFCFITGYEKPTIAVLQQSGPLPVGHASQVMHTCRITLLAIDIHNKSASIIWQQSNLPHDSFRMFSFSLTNPTKVAIVLVTMNALIFISQNSVVGIAANGFASTTVSSDIRLQSLELEEGFELDLSQWIQAGNNCLVGSLKDGRLISINISLPLELSCNNAKFDVSFLAKSIIASCICTSADKNIWFIGSRVADCLLLKVDSKVEINSSDISSIATHSSSIFATPNQKRQRSRLLSRGTSGSSIVKDNYSLSTSIPISSEIGDAAGEENFLYGSTLQNLGINESVVLVNRLKMEVIDTIKVLGPVLNGMFTGPDEVYDQIDKIEWRRGSKLVDKTSQTCASAYIVEREAKDSLQISAGLDEESSLYRINRGLRVSKLANRNFPGALSVHSLYCSSYENVSVIFLSFTKKTRVLRCMQSTEVSIQEISSDDSGFVGSDETIAVGFIANDLVVQVFENGARLVKLNKLQLLNNSIEGNPLEDVLISDSKELGGLGGLADEIIIKADLCNGWLVLLTSTNTIHILEYDSSDESLVVRHSGSYSSDFDLEENGNLKSLNSYLQDMTINISLFLGCFPTVINEPFVENLSTQDVDINLKEDSYLYGEEKADVCNVNIALATPNENLKRKATAEFKSVDIENNNNNNAYIVINDVSGRVTIVRIKDLHCVLRTTAVAKMMSKVMLGDEKEDVNIVFPERVVIDSRLVRLGRNDSPMDLTKLSLVSILDNDDLVVYNCNEIDGNAICFTKLEHAEVTRKRRNKSAKISKKSTIFETSSSTTLNETSNESYLNHKALKFEKYFGEESKSFGKLIYFDDFDGRNCVAVSGIRPLLVVNDTGLPSVIPLGLPELPFFNAGSFSLSPFKMGKTRGIATLWQEFDNFENTKTSAKQSVLGLYQEVPGLNIHGGKVTMKKIHVGQTIHHSLEILPKTDDRIEISLLNKKTTIISCSEEVKSTFLAPVLTGEEIEKEEKEHERFFPDLSSFCQPDKTVGAAPPLISRKHKLSLVQGGTVVDTYNLLDSEHVLDIDILYLNVEIPQPIQIMQPQLKKQNRRVFVAASTGVSDKHGEDTQGEGRLMLFALDYAIFHSENNTKAKQTTSDSEKNEDVIMDESDNIKDSATALSQELNLSTSTAQSKFLSTIQPKLKLIWTGPGPASVVKQFGDNILTTIGPIVYIYKFNQETLELDQISFYFAKVSFLIKYIILIFDFNIFIYI
jgi:hypothetical protein